MCIITGKVIFSIKKENGDLTKAEFEKLMKGLKTQLCNKDCKMLYKQATIDHKTNKGYMEFVSKKSCHYVPESPKSFKIGGVKLSVKKFSFKVVMKGIKK